MGKNFFFLVWLLHYISSFSVRIESVSQLPLPAQQHCEIFGAEEKNPLFLQKPSFSVNFALAKNDGSESNNFQQELRTQLVIN
jgi:hypothetical protein